MSHILHNKCSHAIPHTDVLIGPKNQNLRIFIRRGIKATNNERISNLVSEFKSNNIWPLFGKKLVKDWILPVFDHFFPKRGSNVRLEFWDQIWNPLTICSLYDRFLSKFSNLLFSPIVILKFWMAHVVNFFEFKIFKVRFGISITKDTWMGGIAIALPETNVITTWPNVLTANSTAMLTDVLRVVQFQVFHELDKPLPGECQPRIQLLLFSYGRTGEP